MSREARAERDVTGILAAGIAFCLIGLLTVHAVVDLYWPERYLIGAGLFLALGAVSLCEAFTAGSIRYVKVRLETVTGETLFATADAADAQALERAIAAGTRHPA